MCVYGGCHGKAEQLPCGGKAMLASDYDASSTSGELRVDALQSNKSIQQIWTTKLMVAVGLNHDHEQECMSNKLGSKQACSWRLKGA